MEKWKWIGINNNKNKGFSLIEVLVTVAVIAIVSIPLLRVFDTANKVELKAKQMQNATDSIQTVIEELKAKSIEEILANYNREVNANPLDESIVLTNIGDKTITIDGDVYNYIRGNNGEKFFVRVKLDPASYDLSFNDFNKPHIGNIYSGNNVVIQKEVTNYDKKILLEFERDFLIPSPSTENITKKNVIMVDVTQDVSATDEYVVDYKYIVTYTYNNAGVLVSITKEFDMGTQVLDNSIVKQDVYLMYTPLDIYSNDYKAKDQFEINYNYTGDVLKEKDLNVYVINQDKNHYLFNDKIMSLNSLNFLAVVNGVMQVDINNIHSGKIKLRTNTEGINPITHGDKEKLLYNMRVMVSKDEPVKSDETNVFTFIETTKEG